MNRRSRNAFTLVEMLVVIAIIAMLTAILVPAVNMAREAGRRATCTNNQHELSLAITQYDASKGHLPGYANTVGANVLSWVPVLFQYLGRNDLWVDSGWRAGAGSPQRIAQLVCPDDPAASTGTPIAALSYVVCVGLYNDQTKVGTITTPGPFRNYTGGSPDPFGSLSDAGSPSRTLLLAEVVTNNSTPVRSWDGLSLAAAQSTAYSWPDPTTTTPIDLSTALVASNISGGATAPLFPQVVGQSGLLHPGVVLITFCDGHVDAVPVITKCSDYLAVLR